MPFRVLAGPNSQSLQPLQLNNNDPESAFIVKSDIFEGRIVGNIKGFDGDDGTGDDAYFERPDRKKDGTTWSIQVQGRFLKPISANDVMFGNTFERPLKLPWGSGAALQFASYIDPVLTHDLTSQKPWALSPLISTMPHFKATSHPSTSSLPSFNPLSPIEEDVSVLLTSTTTATPPPSPFKSPSKRRKYYEKTSRRELTQYTEDVVLQMDFCYGYFQFFPDLVLAIPGGITFDLKKYWDGQPVRFVCCRRGKDGGGPGEEFFVVQFDLGDDEAEKGSARSGKSSRKGSPSARSSREKTPPSDKDNSNDVD